ncbi:MAG TPA: S41 family peptidase [Kofleriaceae bacterium]
MSRASHVAAFAAGAVAAAALVRSHAAPAPDVARFKTLDAFAQALATVETSYVDPVEERKLVYDAVRGMLHNLDPHSTFLPPNRYEALRQNTEGEFGGVGLTLAPGELDEARPSVPPFPSVDEIVRGSPADVAGLQLDDKITAIDGQPTAEAGKELRDAGAWEQALRGPSGTRVTLSILRVGWHEPKPFAIVRAQVKQPTVKEKTLEPGIGYLAITHFSESTGADVAAALGRLGKLDALVLDLRANPGGLVDQSVAVADQFLDDGVIVTQRGRGGTTETQTAHKGGLATSVPVVAIVDGGTASAAEILAAALHDHKRATLVGLPTYGKGTVQTFFDLDDGSGLKLTTARYYTPAGNSLESKGIAPDVRVDALTPEVIVAGSGAASTTDATINADDPQLAAAITIARRNRSTHKK